MASSVKESTLRLDFFKAAASGITKGFFELAHAPLNRETPHAPLLKAFSDLKITHPNFIADIDLLMFSVLRGLKEGQEALVQAVKADDYIIRASAARTLLYNYGRGFLKLTDYEFAEENWDYLVNALQHLPRMSKEAHDTLLFLAKVKQCGKLNETLALAFIEPDANDGAFDYRTNAEVIFENPDDRQFHDFFNSYLQDLLLLREIQFHLDAGVSDFESVSLNPTFYTPPLSMQKRGAFLTLERTLDAAFSTSERVTVSLGTIDRFSAIVGTYSTFRPVLCERLVPDIILYPGIHQSFLNSSFYKELVDTQAKPHWRHEGGFIRLAAMDDAM